MEEQTTSALLQSRLYCTLIGASFIQFGFFRCYVMQLQNVMFHNTTFMVLVILSYNVAVLRLMY